MKSVPESFKSLTTDEQYHKFWKEFNQIGKNCINNSFQLHEQDNLVLLKLFIYLFADDDLATIHSMDTEKGILLIGPPGCGKTTLMQLLSWLIEIEWTFPIVSTIEVAADYKKEGHNLIKKYTKSSFHSEDNPKHYCFDGLETEKPTHYLNNPCNTMEVILRSRYDYYETHGMVTHITTNLSLEEIEQRYDLSLVRIYKIFNVIVFNSNSPNKRK